MSQLVRPGTCNLCGKSFSRSVLTQHLKRCGLPSTRRSAAPIPAKLGHGSFHLFVDAAGAQEYFLHLAVAAANSLLSVDRFLRKTWLECCGHMSAFTIERTHYCCEPPDDLDALGMDLELHQALRPGMLFTYEYDFGSTTELRLKVVGFWERGTKSDEIELLARNDAPTVVCSRCGRQPATKICTDCQGWFCIDCALEHGCGEESLLPVVNSPRAGVCGYCG
jgi:hypothetical protein